MTSMNKGALCALALVVLMALGLQMDQARAEEPTSGTAVTVAMAPAPLPVVPLAEPVLLCGNVWVKTDYVLYGNCYKACINEGHSPAACKSKFVPLCQSCWKKLTACANSPAIPPAQRCKTCTIAYAKCMGPFFQ